MRTPSPTPRGMALIMAMVVVVLVTLLVAGAISFTGTELAASQVQSQEDVMSSCVQAARNLFLSKLNLLDPAGPANIQFDETLGDINVRTGHLGGVMIASAEDVSDKMKDPYSGVEDISNRDTALKKTRYYFITAVCREKADDPSSPEREIEFMVRVGL